MYTHTPQEQQWADDKKIIEFSINRNIRSGEYVYGVIKNSTKDYITIQVYDRENKSDGKFGSHINSIYIDTNTTAMIYRESISIMKEINMNTSAIK